MRVEVIPTGSGCGAEIKGIDLRKPLSEELAQYIYNAWLEHLVVFFRGQNLEEKDHLRFTEYFGSAGDYMRPSSLRNDIMKDRHNAVMFVSNIRENGQPIGALPDGEMMFHTDTAYDTKIHKATTLYAIEIPSDGGETIFSNQYAVYKALPEKLKQELKIRQAYTAYEFGTTVKNKAEYNDPEMRSANHPVFRTHEETGKKSVFVNELMTEKIIGLSDGKSSAYLDQIFAMQRETGFCYEHRWQVGDLVIWDNRCSLHARRDFPRNQRRLLRRITVQGDRPMSVAL